MNPIPLEKDLANLLEQWGYGIVYDGSTGDIFIDEFVENVIDGFMVTAAPSPPPHQYLDTLDVVIDFWYRSADSQKSYRELAKIFNAFFRKANFQTDNYYVYFCEILGNISGSDRDIEGSKLKSFSVQFKCRSLSSVS